MPLQVVCPSCNAKLKAPDTAAGKKTKCPKCQAVISVPVDAPQAPAGSPGTGKKAENWYMQTTDGSQFGPVPRSELDDWFKEGRISAECQLLKEGADQWQWASEIYPSLDQSAPAVPRKPTDGFDFLGPAPSSNDPLGLGNAPLGTPLPSTAILNYQAPAFPAGYGGGGYGSPANPYASPSAMSYGSQYGGKSRRGLHPLVITASVIEFFYGGIYALGTIAFAAVMIFLLVGGAAIAANAPANNPEAENVGPALAALTGMGMLCMLPFMLLFLGLSVLFIATGVGLLRKRFWAKIVSIVMSILFLLLQSFALFMAVISLDPCSLVMGLVGFALHATILTAMCIPDCTTDFA